MAHVSHEAFITYPLSWAEPAHIGRAPIFCQSTEFWIKCFYPSVVSVLQRFPLRLQGLNQLLLKATSWTKKRRSHHLQMVNFRFRGKKKETKNSPQKTTNQRVPCVPQTWKYPLPHECLCSSICSLHHLLQSAACPGKPFSFWSHFLHSFHQHHTSFAWCFQVLQLFLQWPEIRTIILDMMHAAHVHSLHHTLIKTTSVAVYMS